MTRNRRWTLARRPEGRITVSDFALVEADEVDPELKAGEVLVANRMFAVAPTIRNWLKPPSGAYRASIPLGGTIRGMAACEVLASKNDAFPVGSRMIAMSEWTDRNVIRPHKTSVPVFHVPPDMDFAQAMGPLSLNSLTAYFGLLDVGRPLAGETVLISGAAGSVGSVVCQIARIKGCRVIGIAGGADKCARLVEQVGVDAAIDYLAAGLAERLAELCPRGIDLFFDNVGGAQLRMGLEHMASHGRIVLCGQIATYDGNEPATNPLDLMKVVYGRLRIEGFVVGDYVDRADEARGQLQQWMDCGQLRVAVDLRDGLEQLPTAFVDLFSGANRGSVLVTND